MRASMPSPEEVLKMEVDLDHASEQISLMRQAVLTGLTPKQVADWLATHYDEAGDQKDLAAIYNTIGSYLSV